MPLYEFRCAKGHSWELEYPMSNIPDRVRCETCMGGADRVYSAPSIHFVGSGFHNTDYRKNDKTEAKETPTPQETKAKADANQGSISNGPA
jgi:putative FmdB family regulatory protein